MVTLALTDGSRITGCLTSFFYDPRAQADPYPDRRISVGPRGGIRTENG